jgi:pimeloyl-ACP methyl ester carboxylesterase
VPLPNDPDHEPAPEPDPLAALRAAPRTRAVEVPGGPLAVLDVTPDSGAAATAVLVPGYTGSKEDFLLLLEPLRAAGLRVVALDQRGQHETPGRDDPAAHNVEALASDLLALLGTLPGPVHLVGHSFGGLVARAAVLRRPAAVRSLVLLASGPGALSGPRVERLRAIGPLLAEGGMAGVFAAMESTAEVEPGSPEAAPAWRAFLRDRFLASSPVALRAMGDALLAEPDRVAELAALDLPVLVLFGDGDDAWSPAAQQDMAERLGARAAVLSGVAHSPAMQAPAATARVLLEHFSHVGRR